jgi:capsular polysaccharide biosynthesis protein
MTQTRHDQAARPARAGEQADEEGLLAPVLRHWKLCLLAPVGLAVAAYLAGMLLPRQYRAEAVVASSAVEFGQDELSLQPLPAADLASFFRDPEAIEAVRQRLKLGEAGCTESQFLAAVTVTSPREGQTVAIAVELNDAALAAEAATALAREGSARHSRTMTALHDAMVRKLRDEKHGADKRLAALADAEDDLARFEADAKIETLRSRVSAHASLRAEREMRLERLAVDLDITEAKAAAYEKELAEGLLAERYRAEIARKAGLASALEELKKVEDELAASGMEWEVESLQEQASVALALRGERRRRRATLEVQLAVVRKEIAELESSLKARPRTLDLERKLVDSPALQQILSKLSGQPAAKLTELDLSVSVLNPTYSSLEAALARARVEESKLVTEQAEIDAALDRFETDWPVLKKKIIALSQRLRPEQHRRKLAGARFSAAGDALAEAEAVLSAIYLPAARRLIDTQKRRRDLLAEKTVMQKAKADAENALGLLQEELAETEKRLREKRYARDKARQAADGALAGLRRVESIPIWPPQSLTVLPAAVPASASWPKKRYFAVGALVVGFFLAWAGALVLDRRRSAGERA